MEERFDRIEYLIGKIENTYLKKELKLLKFDKELEIQKSKSYAH